MKNYWDQVLDKSIENNIFLTWEKMAPSVNNLYCHLKGFDPNYFKYRVGSLLTLKVLEQCIAKGLVEYDFMQGAEAYKFDWTDKFRTNINIKLVNKKVSSSLINVGLKVLSRSKIDTILIKYVLALSALRSLFKKL